MMVVAAVPRSLPATTPVRVPPSTVRSAPRHAPVVSERMIGSGARV